MIPKTGGPFPPVKERPWFKIQFRKQICKKKYFKNSSKDFVKIFWVHSNFDALCWGVVWENLYLRNQKKTVILLIRVISGIT